MKLHKGDKILVTAGKRPGAGRRGGENLERGGQGVNSRDKPVQETPQTPRGKSSRRNFDAEPAATNRQCGPGFAQNVNNQPG